MKKKILIIFLALLITLNSAFCFASVIHGTVYDMNLDTVKGAIVEVNSTPMQRMVASNGSYSFSLNDGDYLISAQFNDNGDIQKNEEKVRIEADGDFVLDLFLFSDISGEESILSLPDLAFAAPFSKSYFPYLLIIAILIFAFLIILILVYLKKINVSKNEVNLDDLSQKVLFFVEKSGGRTTQKEIRKEIPLSEAKISLLISELEEKGKIRKIKKGRGNILVLNK